MGVQRQTQIAERAIFPLDRFDNLLIKIAAGFFPVERQSVAYFYAFSCASDKIALLIVYARVENAAFMC